MYASKKARYLYATAFLSSILQCNWVAKDQKIQTDPDRGYSYLKFVSFLQERKLPAHVRTANFIIGIGYLQQWNNQLVLEIIVYLNKLEFQIAPHTKTGSAETICSVPCTNIYNIQLSNKVNLRKLGLN